MGPMIPAAFSPATRAWFEAAFPAPTPAQAGAWEAIASGEHALVVAPTGSGKTLAAFLWALDRLLTGGEPPREHRLRVVYVSPLKALAVDIERNLRSPLAGVRAQADRLGIRLRDVAVAVRTGDTPAADRRRLAAHPPDILITTPESLYLLLTSSAREALRSVETVVVDEVHAVVGSKRGAHLALSLERLDELLERPAQRIGLSATVRPTAEVARFLAGGRPVVVEPPQEKRWDLRVEVPVEDMTTLGVATGEIREGDVLAGVERTSIWPAVVARLVELIEAHRSTIVFANSRRLAERLCAMVNERAGRVLARAHHGSVAREQRLAVEEDLKAGRLPAVVATSSLELGIDMGAVDLVVQVEAPTSVTQGVQRIGRAGHQVGATSRGIVFPKHRGDLVPCAVVVSRMREGAIEEVRYPRNPLDVLAQQVVAMVAVEDWDVDALEKVIRRAAPFEDLPRSAFEGVLDMLAGRYPSDEFAELRPRLVWDRIGGRLTARPGARRLAVTSGGTIPDRGLFPVVTAGERPTRVGELDEEMVYESRVGDVFVLGATSWRIEDITRDRVVVSPAPGVPGQIPFWHGDAAGRPVELGRAIGAFLREVQAAAPEEAERRLAEIGLEANARRNLLAYLAEQRRATGVLPDDRTIVVERFRDELGDWRITVHTPFGARVHAPWALAIETLVRERLGLEVQTMHTDDGIVVRLPEADEAPAAASVVIPPEEVEDLVVGAVGSSALFAGRFRECAARALLLPRRRPDRRTPLWQQRQRAADLLQVAARHGSFPILLETYRECLQDVFDLAALRELMERIERRDVRLVEVDTPAPSPFASALQFGYVAAFMYEGDQPLAERRAQALTLDRRVLAELLGTAELRELVDAGALADLELELQRLAPGRRIRDAEDLHDALRDLGDLSVAEAAARGAEPAWVEELLRARRALRLRVAGEERLVAAEDAARYRDALGAALPPGVPDAFLAPVADPLGDLVSRYARTHGPFHAGDLATRLGLGVAVVEETLRRLAAAGRVVEGEFRPGGAGREWVDQGVLRALRRRSLAAFRREAEPVPPEALARFLPAWQDVGSTRPATAETLLAVLDQLQGALVPASDLEPAVLGARLAGETGPVLDALAASGAVVWAGSGAIGPGDGWVSLCLAEQAPALLPPPLPGPLSEAAERVREALAARGALFFRQVAEATRSTDDVETLLALWELVWAGHVTNDTLAPLRALVAAGGLVRRAPRRRPALPARLGPPAGAGRWSLLPERETDPTRRLHAAARQLLARHGVLTRGAVAAERAAGGFAALYPVLAALEEAGRCRRGYFVEGLGGAQFAVPGAVDRLRALAGPAGGGSAPGGRRALPVQGLGAVAPLAAGGPVVLAAADPANPFGAALPWPDPPGMAGSGGRPGRKAGARVVLADGRAVLYVERGGRFLVVLEEDPDRLEESCAALADAARRGVVARLAIERAAGAELRPGSPLAEALLRAGFVHTPKGYRVRP
jgi:ATP-dependent Lhr-like helicase